MSNDTLTIYRLEDGKGIGPYFEGIDEYNHSYIEKMNEMIEEDLQHRPNIWNQPIPRNDPGLGDDFDREHVFGFASLAQYLNWMHMPEWREGLAQLGVMLNVYQVPAEAAKASNFQAVFDKKQAQLGNSLRPDAVE